jgi:hydrogenase expression/formation protein HypD
VNLTAAYRHPDISRKILAQLRQIQTRPWVIMEVCGGQTHGLLAAGIDQLVPKELELVHGPGCPVCVTPLEKIDKAIAIAGKTDVIFTTFGDMLRVPGSQQDLLTAKSMGADVRIVYSPLDAIQLAKKNPQKKVVFFAVGFETTAPNTAMAVWLAKQQSLDNFSLLVSHVLVAPAMAALLAAPHNRVQAYLAAGHVCSVMGWQTYEIMANTFHVPIVITGFEPVDLLHGILQAVTLLEKNKWQVVNAYERVAARPGNLCAQEQINRVFDICDREWRGLGMIPASGLRLQDEYSDHDAECIFALPQKMVSESSLCIIGEVLQGLKKPLQCPAFGRQCTPQSPLGAAMVSGEGVCAAYYQYHSDFVSTGE